MNVNKVSKFFNFHALSGIVLLFCAVLALFLANFSATSSYYQSLLELPFYLKLGPLELKKNFLLLVNDGLMAIFFLLIAIEIKQEVLTGHLSDLKKAFLPCCAALGGILVPVIIFLSFTWNNSLMSAGWAIPAATDIAFSLGILALVGSHAPAGLKIFLTAVAVIDDLAAIVIIALFYTSQLSFIALGLALLCSVLLLFFNSKNINALTPYLLVGAIIWICVLKSGVHATLAGVIVGLAIPSESKDDGSESSASRIEHYLQGWVAFAIVPLFAFVNSGVKLSGLTLEEVQSPLVLGIALGLCIGKPLGVFGSCYLLVKNENRTASRAGNITSSLTGQYAYRSWIHNESFYRWACFW